ncbi:hypothetical protein [Mesorhizobium caraganae]|uniref:hypothetical protein n=1 Tax=Mesorhizobium caraganae TaxID=483206 RepID=UPI001782859E|nr:hypothetical protein [Mesorhizobium caraganae]
MAEPEHGHVILYSYLWARVHRPVGQFTRRFMAKVAAGAAAAIRAKNIRSIPRQ